MFSSLLFLSSCTCSNWRNRWLGQPHGAPRGGSASADTPIASPDIDQTPLTADDVMMLFKMGELRAFLRVANVYTQTGLPTTDEDTANN